MLLYWASWSRGFTVTRRQSYCNAMTQSTISGMRSVINKHNGFGTRGRPCDRTHAGRPDSTWLFINYVIKAEAKRVHIWYELNDQVSCLPEWGVLWFSSALLEWWIVIKNQSRKLPLPFSLSLQRYYHNILVS